MRFGFAGGGGGGRAGGTPPPPPPPPRAGGAAAPAAPPRGAGSPPRRFVGVGVAGGGGMPAGSAPRPASSSPRAGWAHCHRRARRVRAVRAAAARSGWRSSWVPRDSASPSSACARRSSDWSKASASGICSKVARPPGRRPTGALTSRRSRAAASRAWHSSLQRTVSRAWASPAASAWRAQSSTWCSDRLCPRKRVAVSGSWCASSNTTICVSGNRSVMPSSRSARSAMNRAWLTTTTSASWAWRRAFSKKQSRTWGQSWPRQFSRVEVTRFQMSAVSGTSGRSARSPLSLSRVKRRMARNWAISSRDFRARSSCSRRSR